MIARWIRSNRGFLAFLFLFGLFRTAIADWNPIPSGSMRPTLLEGDVVFVNRLAYQLKVPLTDIVVARTGEPQRGDIVTFSSPKDGTRLIKRLVALPGDTVEMRGKLLIVNGTPATYEPIAVVQEPLPGGGRMEALQLDEKIGANTHLIQWLRVPPQAANGDFAPVVVPPDHYMMLGDNRDNSSDSRYIGLVRRELIIGRAVAILASADILDDWAFRTDRFIKRLN